MSYISGSPYVHSDIKYLENEILEQNNGQQTDRLHVVPADVQDISSQTALYVLLWHSFTKYNTQLKEPQGTNVVMKQTMCNGTITPSVGPILHTPFF